MASNIPKGDKWELIDNDIDSLNYGKKFMFDFSYIVSENIKNFVKAFVWRNYKENNMSLSSLYRYLGCYFEKFIKFSSSTDIYSLNQLTNNHISKYVSYLKTTLSNKTGKPLNYQFQKKHLDVLKAIIRWGQMYMPDEVPKVEIFTGNEYLGVNRKLKIDFIPDVVVKKNK